MSSVGKWDVSVLDFLSCLVSKSIIDSEKLLCVSVEKCWFIYWFHPQWFCPWLHCNDRSYKDVWKKNYSSQQQKCVINKHGKPLMPPQTNVIYWKWSQTYTHIQTLFCFCVRMIRVCSYVPGPSPKNIKYQLLNNHNKK